MRVRLIFTAALIASLPAAAQSTSSKPVPRLANGKPDLTGVWDHPRVGDVSKDVNGRCAGGTAGCSSIGAHDLDSTLTPFGKAENAKPKFDYGVHCLPWGYVRSWGTPYPVELVQKPEKLAILFEQNNMFHVVPTDGRDHSKNLYPTWLGDSVGHWEGDTLVVDTIGSNGQTWLDTEPERLTSDALHVIERFSRPDYNHIQYEITADDPKMYTKPWKNTRVFVLMPPGQELLEYSCDENNKEITEGHITDSWTKKK
jgi:hypothetical protein